MDSLTQAALGASVGHLCWGRQIGPKALLVGAVLGTVPDLDVLIYPFLDQVERLYWHRGESHSIFFILLGSLATAWLLRRYRRTKFISFKRAALGALLIYATHILIDLFTVYGTQVFAPFSRKGFGFGNMFIIDPLFTLPLLLGIIAAAMFSTNWGHRVNKAGLAAVSLYTIWSFSIQAVAADNFRKSTAELNIPVVRQMTTAAPFTTFLWRHLIETPDGFLLAYWSVFDPPAKELTFHFLPRQAKVVEEVRHTRNFAAVEWFSQGWWCVIHSDEGSAKIVDLRFTEIPGSGQASHLSWNWPFAWRFELNSAPDLPLQAVPPDVQEPLLVLSQLGKRILGEGGWLTPIKGGSVRISSESGEYNSRYGS
jgi:inner membrane protein